MRLWSTPIDSEMGYGYGYKRGATAFFHFTVVEVVVVGAVYSSARAWNERRSSPSARHTSTHIHPYRHTFVVFLFYRPLLDESWETRRGAARNDYSLTHSLVHSSIDSPQFLRRGSSNI